MTKEQLQHTWWVLVRGSRGPLSGSQGFTAPQFGKHPSRGILNAAALLPLRLPTQSTEPSTRYPLIKST